MMLCLGQTCLIVLMKFSQAKLDCPSCVSFAFSTLTLSLLNKSKGEAIARQFWLSYASQASELQGFAGLCSKLLLKLRTSKAKGMLFFWEQQLLPQKQELLWSRQIFGCQRLKNRPLVEFGCSQLGLLELYYDPILLFGSQKLRSPSSHRKRSSKFFSACSLFRRFGIDFLSASGSFSCKLSYRSSAISWILARRWARCEGCREELAASSFTSSSLASFSSRSSFSSSSTLQFLRLHLRLSSNISVVNLITSSGLNPSLFWMQAMSLFLVAMAQSSQTLLLMVNFLPPFCSAISSTLLTMSWSSSLMMRMLPSEAGRCSSPKGRLFS